MYVTADPLANPAFGLGPIPPGNMPSLMRVPARPAGSRRTGPTAPSIYAGNSSGAGTTGVAWTRGGSWLCGRQTNLDPILTEALIWLQEAETPVLFGGKVELHGFLQFLIPEVLRLALGTLLCWSA